MIRVCHWHGVCFFGGGDGPAAAPSHTRACMHLSHPSQNPKKQDFDAVEYINAKFASVAAAGAGPGGGAEVLDEALDPFIAQVTAEIGASWFWVLGWSVWVFGGRGGMYVWTDGDRCASPPTDLYTYSHSSPQNESPGALDLDISEAIEAQAKAGEQATKDISEAQVRQIVCVYIHVHIHMNYGGVMVE